MKGEPVFALLMLGACASGQPAPIDFGGRAASPRAQTAAPAPANETALSAYALRPEDVQPFDPAHLPRSHRVSGDESLYEIATRYQVPLRALIDQNRLEPPYSLQPGGELELPPPRYHEVARGERFEDVARHYNVDLRSLALLNRMAPPYQLRAGDRVYLPAMAREHVEAPAPRQTTPPRTGRFAWPLRGEIVRGFGAQQGGERSDGIEIAGREGAQIVAAADGDVVYAGADLAAYGTLVLIRHADDYVTAYAYARRSLVQEGERVRAGQAIAELGARPNGRAALLFQVRRGRSKLDPAPLLGAT
jgi:murein DD-endopeptidase MepM/ murein hydrolase activator NlpD